MELKLFDSERKVMEVLWDHGDLSAKELADRLKELVGWSKTTTYTVIKKCIDKKAVSRSEPGFVCHPLVSREEVREQETDALIDRMYGSFFICENLRCSIFSTHYWFGRIKIIASICFLCKGRFQINCKSSSG